MTSPVMFTFYPGYAPNCAYKVSSPGTGCELAKVASNNVIAMILTDIVILIF